MRRRFRKSRPPQAPPGSDDHMMATLAALGVPASFATSDPMAALSGGFAKASIYRAHQALEAGDFAEAISAATAVIEYPGMTADEGFSDVAAVAFYLRGSAKERSRPFADAKADYEDALARLPDHAGALAGLDRLG